MGRGDADGSARGKCSVCERGCRREVLLQGRDAGTDARECASQGWETLAAQAAKTGLSEYSVQVGLDSQGLIASPYF